MNEIEILVDKYRPDVIGLSESNLKSDVDPDLVKIDDYDVYTALTMKNNKLNISRIVVYTSQNIVAIRRHDLEDENISAIWLEIGLPRQKKILVANLYREWQFKDQEDNSSLQIQ